jgi:hypothetical protein
VPLSEDEQRILSEIEQKLYETDPALAHEVGSTTVYTASVRRLKWSVLLFVVGVAVMIFTLSVHFMVSFTGFVVMLVAALVFSKNLRALGRAGVQQVTQRLSGNGVRDFVGGAGDRMRERFQREDDLPEE